MFMIEQKWNSKLSLFHKIVTSYKLYVPLNWNQNRLVDDIFWTITAFNTNNNLEKTRFYME